MSDLYNIEVKNIEGEVISLENYKGKTLLIVNTASKCGFTPQYKGLEVMYKKLKDRGLEILGFPCNQFGKQEPADEDEIKNFCSLTYNVTFPMFAKIDVNGSEASPLYNYLKTEAPGLLGSKNIKWNFTKFLVDKNGNVIKRFAPKDAPSKIEKEIENLL